MHDKYIIIGCCARSGSVFMQRVLCRCGLQVGHENPDSDGVVGWQQLLSTDAVRRKAMGMAAGREIVYLMQVRHPVSTINSMVGLYTGNFWPTLPDKHPEPYKLRIEATRGQTWLSKAIKLYYHLNNTGMSETAWLKIYKIEAIDTEWPEIAALAGIAGTPLPDTPRTSNTYRSRVKYPNLTWDDICAEEPKYGRAIARMATRWDYDLHNCIE